MIFALAGRRIDAPEVTQPVFPYAHTALVRARIEQLFKASHATALVCSAACGADLLALDVAHSLGIESHIVLPFAPKRFRATSVIDRPGEWDALFDKIIARAQATDRLMNLNLDNDSPEPYLRANEVILQQALSLASTSGDQAAAVLVWDKVARSHDDTTKLFGDAATRLGFKVLEVSTL